MALRLLFVSLFVVCLLEAASCGPRRLQAKVGPTPAAVAAAAAKKPAAKAPALPPLKMACTNNRITGWDIPYIVWNCRLKSTPAQKPFCLRVSCANVSTGDCPKPGAGSGTNTVVPEPCGWGLQSQGDGTCVTKFPIFPKSDTAYGFTVDSRLPVSVKPIGYFYTTDSTCDNQV